MEERAVQLATNGNMTPKANYFYTLFTGKRQNISAVNELPIIHFDNCIL